MRRSFLIGIALFGLVVGSMLILTGCGQEQTHVVQVVEPSGIMAAAKADRPLIQVWETELELGKAKVKDIVEAGGLFQSDSTLQSIEFSEDPHMERDLSFIVGATVLKVHVKNLSGERVPLKDSTIINAYFDGLQVCGIGGVVIGDTLDTVKEKLGEPYLIKNTEEFRYSSGRAALPSNSRVYGYVSRLDDITVKICIDRNSYTVNLIEETVPLNLITEPKQVSDSQVRKLIKDFRKKYAGMKVSATLMDAKNSKTSGSANGTLSSMSFNRIRVLTINDIRDSSQFYDAIANYNNNAAASSYLVVEYKAAITLSDYSGEGEKTSRQDCYGCFYIPNAYITDEGAISCGTSGNTLYRECQGVYTTEDAMLESLFSGEETKYSLSDYTSMDRVI